jgi:hypothetical protein
MEKTMKAAVLEAVKSSKSGKCRYRRSAMGIGEVKNTGICGRLEHLQRLVFG